MRTTDVNLGLSPTLYMCVPTYLPAESYAQHAHTYTERIKRQRDTQREAERIENCLKRKSTLTGNKTEFSRTVC